MRCFYFIWLAFLFLLGCDIPGQLVIENYSKRSAIYRCDFVQTDRLSDIDTGLKTDGLSDINIELSGARPDNTANIYMGFGYRWTDENLNDYAGEIIKLEIISHKDSLVITDKNEILNYLGSRIYGRNKRVILIKIE